MCSKKALYRYRLLGSASGRQYQQRDDNRSKAYDASHALHTLIHSVVQDQRVTRQSVRAVGDTVTVAVLAITRVS